MGFSVLVLFKQASSTADESKSLYLRIQVHRSYLCFYETWVNHNILLDKLRFLKSSATVSNTS